MFSVQVLSNTLNRWFQIDNGGRRVNFFSWEFVSAPEGAGKRGPLWAWRIFDQVSSERPGLGEYRILPQVGAELFVLCRGGWLEIRRRIVSSSLWLRI